MRDRLAATIRARRCRGPHHHVAPGASLAGTTFIGLQEVVGAIVFTGTPAELRARGGDHDDLDLAFARIVGGEPA